MCRAAHCTQMFTNLHHHIRLPVSLRLVPRRLRPAGPCRKSMFSVISAAQAEDTRMKLDNFVESDDDWGDDSDIILDWDGAPLPVAASKGHLPAVIKSVVILGAIGTAVVMVGKSSLLSENQGILPAPTVRSENVDERRSLEFHSETIEEVADEVDPNVSVPSSSNKPEKEVDVQENESGYDLQKGIADSVGENARKPNGSLPILSAQKETGLAENSKGSGENFEEPHPLANDNIDDLHSLLEADYSDREQYEPDFKEEDSRIVSTTGYVSGKQEDREPKSALETSRAPGETSKAEPDNSSMPKSTVTLDEIDRLAESMTAEELRQKALLAARAASAASEAARNASEHSTMASSAAHDAVLAAEEAVAAAGAVQNALEIGTKRDVLLAEKRVAEAARIALGAESRARDAAAQIDDHKTTATQQADVAADLASLRRLRGPGILDQVAETARAAWNQVATFLRNILSSILEWVGMIWLKACRAWPSLETSFNSGVTLSQNIVGDIGWFVHEGFGIFGDLFDRLMSGMADFSMRALTWARTIAPKFWENLMKIYARIRMLIRTVIAEIRKTFSS